MIYILHMYLQICLLQNIIKSTHRSTNDTTIIYSFQFDRLLTIAPYLVAILGLVVTPELINRLPNLVKFNSLQNR